MTLFTVQCGQYARSTPYFAVRPMLRALVGIPVDASSDDAARLLGEFVARAAPELLPWLPLLAIPLDANVPLNDEAERIAPQFRRAHAHQALGELFALVARDPTMVLVEDLHWVDDASADIIRELTVRAARHPWLILLSRRPGPAPLAEGPEEFESITLTALDAPAALQLVVAAAGGEGVLGPYEWARLVERTGGNPLFAIELAAAARTHGSAEALADSVESLVTSRIDTLPARTGSSSGRARCSAASSTSSSSPTRWSATTCATPPVGDRSPTSSYPRIAKTFRFRHTIHHQVAYEGLPFRRRREVHGRATRAIEDRFGDRVESVTGLLSTHYFRAGLHDSAWSYSVAAGDEARDEYANVEAAEFYRRRARQRAPSRGHRIRPAGEGRRRVGRCQ